MPERKNKRKREYFENDIDDHFENHLLVLDKKEWVSASSIHNYMLDDPVLDYFKYIGKYKYGRQKSKKQKKKRFPNTYYNEISKNLLNSEQKNNGNIVRIKSKSIEKRQKSNINFETNFFEFITDKGNQFEDKVIDYLLNDRLPRILPDIVILSNIFVQASFSHFEVHKASSYEKTIDLMKKGVPIIYQGVLHNYKNKTFGSPDLIVRSDYINYLTNEPTLTNEESFKGSDLSEDYHYRIIDIKYHTISLRSDGKRILNGGRMKANKGQIMLYNMMLEDIQGFIPNEWLHTRTWI